MEVEDGRRGRKEASGEEIREREKMSLQEMEVKARQESQIAEQL